MASIRVRRATVKELTKDEHYARNINLKAVQNIVTNYNPDALGVLVINVRKDGKEVVIDGNHRLAALRHMKRNEMVVDVIQFEGLSMAQEAGLFADLNKQVPMHGAVRFKALVVAGDKVANEIAEVLRQNKLTVKAGGKIENSIQGVDTLYKLYKQGVLEEALEVAAKAWIPTPQPIPSMNILAIGEMFKRWPSLEKKRLIEALADRDPVRWRNDIKAVGQAAGEHHTRKVAVEVFVRAYNHGRAARNRLRMPARWKTILG